MLPSKYSPGTHIVTRNVGFLFANEAFIVTDNGQVAANQAQPYGTPPQLSFIGNEKYSISYILQLTLDVYIGKSEILHESAFATH